MFVEEKSVGELVKTKKLSYAIREGSKLRDQIHGGYLCSRGSCALGAAMEYYGFAKVGDEDETFYEAEEKIKQYCEIPDDVINEVINLNDDHWHSREYIANYLESRGM